jgi:hypothetical protein
MYGFLGDYAHLIECAKALQDHIESVYDRTIPIADEDVPQVSVSLGQCAALIEVDELQVWHSEVDSHELTPESLIEAFTTRCDVWSRFSRLTNHRGAV